MPIKSRRYRKANKSRRTRKNKTTRRYKKKQMGGFPDIKNEEDLRKSWDNKFVNSWLADDNVGTMKRVFKDDFKNFEELKENLAYFLEILSSIETLGLNGRLPRYGYLRKYEGIYIRPEE